MGIGVGLGLLFAPDKGEATRNKLRNRLNDLSEMFSGEIDNVKATGERETAVASDAASHAFEKVSDYSPSKKEPGSEAGTSPDRDVINTLSHEEFPNS